MNYESRCGFRSKTFFILASVVMVLLKSSSDRVLASPSDVDCPFLGVLLSSHVS